MFWWRESEMMHTGGPRIHMATVFYGCSVEYMCGSLSESRLHRLVYLNVWRPDGGTVWEG